MRLRLPPSRGRGPLAIASVIAIPLFFASLMASTLALEKPHTIQWNGPNGRIYTTWHDPTPRNIAMVWLWAFVPPLLLILVGAIATRIPYGFYVSCATGIVLAMAVVHKAATWQHHHTQRYPVGVDLIPPTNPASDKYARGQWERMAHATAVSLSHWTIGVALAAALVMLAITVRRRYFARRPVAMGPPVEGVHAPDSTLPGLGDST